VDLAVARQRLSDARVGRLGTVTSDGRPHVVPCCFALEGERLYSAVDAKPKTTPALRRLENLRRNPAAALLVDHYDEDWRQLWWVRVDGSGGVLDDDAQRAHALTLLAAKYEQYRAEPPPGPVWALSIERWRTWP
jgi:PPOX class probable F420-dependent enzyme